MITRENIVEHLENNPKEKELLDEQINYFLPLWMNEKNKQYTIEKLPQNDIDFMQQALLLTNISEEDIELIRNEADFQNVLDIFTKIKDGNNDLISKVTNIYSKNVSCLVDEHEKEIREYIQSKLPKKKKEQVINLKQRGKDETVKRIIREHYESNPNKYEKIEKYTQQFRILIDILDISVFSCEVLKCNSHLIDTISYAVCYPNFLMPLSLNDVLKDNKEIPCNWYWHRKLTVSDYKEFINNHTNTETWKKQYGHAVNNINENMNVPLISIRKRVHLIKDIFANINEKRFDSALIIIFSVIEGILWELVNEVHKTKKIYISDTEIYDCNKDCNFESKRIRDILERTYAKEYLDNDFLKEFCNELYEERNPVLHGRQICSECPNQGMCILKKIFTLDYIIERLISVFQENLFKVFDETFDKEKTNEFLNISNKKDKL
ncbi:hypothetical protein CHL78_012090 [Romboutsia weinsteinii]|uniref:Apea-like HEPN domain-containing protein n=1 Tax=Romboutsia weinsteinii TaxID=2020949 RepID=A0A371J290_9FIRM|nr:hypothetical protein [Romboutsia weinsteinii]RDY26804.1 hypothetical protein CHL78_012090 [Romboutsia weinsteinii]